MEQGVIRVSSFTHAGTMIFFNAPCDLDICRDGNRVIVKGSAQTQNKKLV
jgi:hypothetical protein